MEKRLAQLEEEASHNSVPGITPGVGAAALNGTEGGTKI